MASVVVMDLQIKSEREYWLSPRSTDTDYLDTCLDKTRAYTKKDGEVVVMSNPSPNLVQVWDPYLRAWVTLLALLQKFPDVAKSLSPSLQVLAIAFVHWLAICVISCY